MKLFRKLYFRLFCKKLTINNNVDDIETYIVADGSELDKNEMLTFYRALMR